jgi:succinate dehydrogenase/fumarate reductase cytochrome b subunit
MDFWISKAYAASSNTATSNTVFNSYLNKIITNIVQPIIYLLMAAAVVYFAYGMVVFIKNADNQEKRKEGYDHMIWGIIGIFIMVSAKGIINLILSTMGL